MHYQMQMIFDHLISDIFVVHKTIIFLISIINLIFAWQQRLWKHPFMAIQFGLRYTFSIYKKFFVALPKFELQ